ncbi:phospholipase D family protein, partial [Pseudomonas syringae]
MNWHHSWCWPVWWLVALGVSRCAHQQVASEPSPAMPSSGAAFGRSIQAMAMPHEGRSGFRLLPDSSDAFKARAELLRNAKSSLDLQYYIVHDGLSTRALIDELLKAADRAVRGRILLDATTSDGREPAHRPLAP